MKKIFLLLLFSISLNFSLIFAQNTQTVIKGVEVSVVSEKDKVLIYADWGDGIIEKINLGYKQDTNNTYELVINDAIINQETLAINSRVTNENYFIIPTFQSKLITDVQLIDSVGENNGKISYRVVIEIKANEPILAQMIGIDKGVLEIQVNQRLLPTESKSTSENTISNVTQNSPKQGGVVTFNSDGTPYVIPEEIASSPRRGFSTEDPNRQPVPQTSGVKKQASGAGQGANAGGDIVSEEVFQNEQGIAGSESSLNSPVGAFGSGQPIKSPPSIITDMSNLDDRYGESNRSDIVYVDESQSGGTNILHGNPALLNVMILAPKKRKREAEKLSIVLNKEKREKIQDRLGLSFRVVNVATIDSTKLKETTIFYRMKYLKSASILADEVDGYQRILKMINPNRKMGVDVEIILGD